MPSEQSSVRGQAASDPIVVGAFAASLTGAYIMVKVAESPQVDVSVNPVVAGAVSLVIFMLMTVALSALASWASRALSSRGGRSE